MTPISVRDAQPADVPAISRVASRSWRETYRDIFDPGFIDDFVAHSYGHGALQEAIEGTAVRPNGAFLVAERDGEVVGYLQFGEGQRGPELWRLYADPAHFGSGVGAALLAELHRRIDGRIESYVLDVHPQNLRGRAFYDHHGFVVAGLGSTPDCEMTLRRTLHAPTAPLPQETARLRLRALEDTDADAAGLHAIYGDAETMRYIGSRGEPAATPGDTRRALAWFLRHQEQHGFSLWAVDEIGGEALVGVAGLLWVEGHGPEVEAAYLVRRDRWGRGYATEVLAAVLDAAFGPLRLPRVVALAWPANDASRHVMEKVGMRADGRVEVYGRTMTRHVAEPQSPSARKDSTSSS